MPEYLRALIVILLIAGIVFAFAKRPALALIEPQTFNRWRNLWFGLTLAAFLTHNFWLYALAAILLLSIAVRRETNKVALFFLTMFLIPAGEARIPGFGIINYLFSINHVILLELAILLPAYLHLKVRGDAVPFGRLAVDKFLLVYLLLMAALQFREGSVTGGARDTLYLFLSVFLPYFVISRSLKTLADFRGAILAFLIATALLAAMGIFEGAKHWLLYSRLMSLLELNWGYSNYLGRSDMLRAQGTTGQPIAFGYVMVVGLGLYLYLKRQISGRFASLAGLALLTVGLAASLSRGPWVGAAMLLAVFTLTGQKPARRLLVLVTISLSLFGVLSILPGGQTIIDLLPWIGNTERGGIEYRERVLDGSLIAIMRNPLFGAADFFKYPEMQALIQGEGIIDIVNTYMLIALRYGLVVMGLFIGFFLLVAWGVFRHMRGLPENEEESKLLGRAILACLIGILATILTVSDITVISTVYWSIAGLGVAYAQMVGHETSRERSANDTTATQSLAAVSSVSR